MITALNTITNRGYLGRTGAGSYSRDTHANTLADCLADIAKCQRAGQSSPDERRNFSECLRSAHNDKMQVRYSASWPAPDGHGWQITLAVTCNDDWPHREARVLIVCIDQFTAIDSILRAHRVQEVSHA